MSNKQPFRDFDLPNKHLATERHYVPPKSRDPEEIARRKQLTKGALIAEQQQKGLAIATAILSQLDQGGKGLRFASRWLAAGSLNTAWYSYAADSEVMRRRLKLPLLASPDPEQRPSALMLHSQAVSSMRYATAKATEVAASAQRGRLIETKQAQAGRNVGHAALTLACFAVGDFIGYESASLDDFSLQALARQRGLASLEDARTLAQTIGVAPSIAQLANPDSPLSVFWRQEAPQEAYEAYELAAAYAPLKTE